MQKAREKKRMIELGLSPPEIIIDTQNEEEDDEKNETDEPPAPTKPGQARLRKRKRDDT